MSVSVGDSLFKRLLVRLGLIYPPEGRVEGKRRRSRYGIYTSARVDQDIDELRARIARIEARD